MANFPSNNAAFPGTGVDSRSVFITRTYTHLVGGILGFILVELGLFESGLAAQIFRAMAGMPWLLILAAFMLTGWLASRTAQSIPAPVTYPIIAGSRRQDTAGQAARPLC